MPQRFGQQTDISQNLAYLARNNYAQMQASAERVDRRREEDLAAKDAMMFKKYQEGKVSGREIIAYIQQRINQTGYSRAQQRQWRATLVEYKNAVADEEATAAYEQTGDIGAFINHWKRRLAGAKRGTPERTQILQVLNQLREQRDGDEIRRGAERIMLKIQKGQATSKDLIDYYKGVLKGGGLSDEMRQQVKTALGEVQVQHRNEQYQIAQLKVDERLARGEITPQEAADLKEGNAEKWGILKSNPVAFQQLQGELRVLRATPDPKEVAKAEADLKAGKITVAEFADMMEGWADMIAPFDQKAAWELRGDARQIRNEYLEAQKLKRPEVIGQYGSQAANTINNFIGRRLQHITQLDGSAYSQLNCTMAAGAMMGHTLGTQGLTGADLRAKTGDRVGGTTLLQAKYALEQSGVNGLRYKDGLAYDKFKQNVKQGATVMLSGYLGNMAKYGFNNGGWNANHTVYVARYDPKKGYLILDPAINRKGYKGQWFSEAAIRAFAWTGTGLGSYSRNGSVLMAPRGTLRTQWNKGKKWDPRKTRKTTKGQAQRERQKSGDTAGYTNYVDIEEGLGFIGVDEPAQTDDGIGYDGQFNPGPDTTSIVTDAWEKIRTKQFEGSSFDTPAHRQRLIEAGIIPGDEGLDTKDEVLSEIARRGEEATSLQEWITNFAEVYDGTDGPFRIVVGSQVRMLTREDISKLEQELVLALDGLQLLNTAVGNDEVAGGIREAISSVILVSQNITATDMSWERNQLFRNAEQKLAAAEAKGPEALRVALTDILGDLGEFAEQWDEEDEVLGPPTEEEMPTEQTEALGQLGELPDIIPVGDVDQPGAKTRNDIILAGYSEGLSAIVDAASDPTMDPDALNMMVLNFAETYNIPMPKGWPDLLEEGAEVSGVGGVLATIISNANVIHQVDNGMGELIYVQGEAVFVPYEYSGGMTPEGERAEGGMAVPSEQVAQETGQELPEELAGMDMVFGTGALPELSIDYIRDTLGIELPTEWTMTGNAIPKGFIIIDGEPQAAVVIPQQVPYKGATMLRIENLDAVKTYFEGRRLTLPANLEEGGFIDADQLASFPPYVKDQLVGAGHLGTEPFLVWQMQLPGQAQPWFQDPTTQKWHYNGLPFVGKGSAMPGVSSSENIGYIGATVDVDGRAIPDVNWGPSDLPHSTGVTTPYGQGISELDAGVMQQSGEGNIESGFHRDPATGEITQMTQDQIQSQYVDIQSAADAAVTAVQTAREMAANTWNAIKEARKSPEERVAELSGMDTGIGLGGSGMTDLMAQSMSEAGIIGPDNVNYYEPPAAGGGLFDRDWMKLIRDVMSTTFPAPEPELPKFEFGGDLVGKPELPKPYRAPLTRMDEPYEPPKPQMLGLATGEEEEKRPMPTPRGEDTR